MQFAKAPRPGRVKTRLQPALSATEAAAIARQLCEHVAGSLAAAARCWDLRLYVDHEQDSFLRALAQRHGMRLFAQGAGDLGQRMARAVCNALAEYPSVIVVGSDCIGYDPVYLEQAMLALREHDAVLGPACDGGYVLIGFSRYREGVFTGPLWGSDRVLEQQRSRFTALGLTWRELAMRADIDRPQDLAQLADPGRDQARVIGRLSP